MILIGLVLISVLSFIGYKISKISISRVHKLKSDLIQNEKEFFESNDTESDDEAYDNCSQSKLILIKENDLEKCKSVGQGAFGTVYVGFYKPYGNQDKKFRVAIKELKISANKKIEIKTLENDIINVIFNLIN